MNIDITGEYKEIGSDFLLRDKGFFKDSKPNGLCITMQEEISSGRKILTGLYDNKSKEYLIKNWCLYRHSPGAIKDLLFSFNGKEYRLTQIPRKRITRGDEVFIPGYRIEKAKTEKPPKKNLEKKPKPKKEKPQKKGTLKERVTQLEDELRKLKDVLFKINIEYRHYCKTTERRKRQQKQKEKEKVIYG